MMTAELLVYLDQKIYGARRRNYHAKHGEYLQRQQRKSRQQIEGYAD
jgi:hypothetical protein